MVRLKSRYILFEVLYPVDHSNEDAALVASRESMILRSHKVSPPDISIKTILQEIRRSLQLNFGDYGSGKANSLLQIKYFSNMTSTGILRCHREDCDMVITALTLMTRISDTEFIIVNPIKVSGTIKKIEEYASRRNEKLVAIVKKSDRSLIDNFSTLSEDLDQDL